MGQNTFSFKNTSSVILLKFYRFADLGSILVDNLVFFTIKRHSELDRISS